MHLFNLLFTTAFVTLVSGQENNISPIQEISISSIQEISISPIQEISISPVTATPTSIESQSEPTTTSPSPLVTTSPTPRGIPSQTYTKLSVNRIPTQSPSSTAVTNQAGDFLPDFRYAVIAAVLANWI